MVGISNAWVAWEHNNVELKQAIRAISLLCENSTVARNPIVNMGDLCLLRGYLDVLKSVFNGIVIGGWIGKTESLILKCVKE